MNDFDVNNIIGNYEVRYDENKRKFISINLDGKNTSNIALVSMKTLLCSQLFETLILHPPDDKHCLHLDYLKVLPDDKYSISLHIHRAYSSENHKFSITSNVSKLTLVISNNQGLCVCRYTNSISKYLIWTYLYLVKHICLIDYSCVTKYEGRVNIPLNCKYIQKCILSRKIRKLTRKALSYISEGLYNDEITIEVSDKYIWVYKLFSVTGNTHKTILKRKLV